MRFYGFLSNAYTAALVSPDGSLDWLPLPRFDSPTVFARLLDRERGGFFSITPVEGGCESRQHYVEGTNCLVTEFATRGGRARLIDYLAVGRPEARRLIRSEIPLRVDVQPVFGYGLTAAAYRRLSYGADFTNPAGREGLLFRICGHGGHRPENGRTCWLLEPGEYELVLRYVCDYESEREAASCEDDSSGAMFRSQQRYWRTAAQVDYAGPWGPLVRRSLLVIRGLTYRTTGAIIAAPTTSLPEALGEERQWDYRFNWIRDGSYAAEALLAVGDVVSARRFMEFVFNLVDTVGKPFRAPFYLVDGTTIEGERELLWLEGFRNTRPCRIGNAAARQVQMDIEGDFLWIVYRYFLTTQDTVFLKAYWWAIEAIVNWVLEQWEMPDASLWEFRNRNRHYTHSKLMCWVALHYGAEMAERLGVTGQARRWREAAATVARAIRRRAYKPASGRFGQSFEGDEPDAALLLLPIYGFLAPDDPAFVKTLQAVENELTEGVFVYRYREDMLGRVAHPFLIASCWLARVYLRQGLTAKARRILEDLSRVSTDLGLFGEHVDQKTGEPRGNFPHLFSHAGFLMTAIELGAAN